MNMKKSKKSKKNSHSLRSEDESTIEDNGKEQKDKDKKQSNKSKKLHDLRGLIELKDADKDFNIAQEELVRKLSSTSINKTNSKILNDVFCDLSSMSSENTQTNIELSEKDKQRITQFKERQKELKATKSKDYKSFRKRFILDLSYFKTCSFYKQLFILILCIMVLLDSSFILSVLSKKQSDEEMRVIVQIIFASVTIVILTAIIFLYVCNLVGRLPQETWLTCECYIYSVFCVSFLINTIILFAFGPQFTLQAVFGIFIILNFFGLSVTKLMMAHLKITAQERIEDPDGNFARARQLNARFSFPKRNILRVWTV